MKIAFHTYRWIRSLNKQSGMTRDSKGQSQQHLMPLKIYNSLELVVMVIIF